MSWAGIYAVVSWGKSECKEQVSEKNRCACILLRSLHCWVRWERSTEATELKTLLFWQKPLTLPDAFMSTAIVTFLSWLLLSHFQPFQQIFFRFSSEVRLNLWMRCVSPHFETAEKRKKGDEKKLCRKSAWLLPRIIRSFQIWPNHCCCLKSHGLTCFSKDQKINVLILMNLDILLTSFPFEMSPVSVVYEVQSRLVKVILSSLLAALDWEL